MIGRISEKIGGSGIFLLSISLIYGTLGIIDIHVVRNALWVSGGLILRISPVLALVFGIMFLTNLLFETGGIVRMLGEGSGLRGWVFAVIGGIISSGPIYMWYPLLGDLKEKGMRESLIAAFLYNRAIKIPLVPMMVHYFGWPFVVILSLYMVIFSVLDGLAVERLTGGRG
jgi:uncharacterized membrane protein YraQ (UPF0718 family)